MTATLPLISAIAYLISGVWLGVRLQQQKKAAGRFFKPTFYITTLSVVLHSIAASHSTLVGEALNFSFFNVATVIALFVVILYLLTILRHPVENLGIILLPFAALVLLAQFFAPDLAPENSVSTTQSMTLDIHILLSLLAYGILSLAAVQSVVLAIQTHYLKSRQPGGFIRVLPPLQSMEGILFQMIALGFILLTIALISGFIFLDDIFAQHLVHKTVLSMIAWVVFAVLLWGHWQYGWRGKKATHWTLGGFTLLLLAYFGSKLVLELILQRI